MFVLTEPTRSGCAASQRCVTLRRNTRLVQADGHRDVPRVACTLHISSHVLPCKHGSISASTGTGANVALPLSGMATRPGHAVPPALAAAKAGIGAS